VTKERRLGRGLAALLGTTPEELAGTGHDVANVHTTATSPAEGRNVDGKRVDAIQQTAPWEEIPVDRIDPNPYQPRRQFASEEIDALAKSLGQHEQLQPILVRKIGDRFQLISGERRWRAAIVAGWKTIRAWIREADDRTVAELAIVENLQRKDLNAIEKACCFKNYLDQHRCTQDELAKRLQIDRSTIANLVRLLDLPEVVQAAVQTDRISAGHARAILGLAGEDRQKEFAERVEREGWSVRETERQVQRMVAESGAIASKSPSEPAKSASSANLVQIESRLKMALGMKVEIQSRGKGAGSLKVHFQSHEQFERLMGLLLEEANQEKPRRAG
jgi:ParB family chromosome partitioning protein